MDTSRTIGNLIFGNTAGTPANNWMFMGWSGSAAPYINSGFSTGPSDTNTDLQFVLPNAVGIATFVASANLTVHTIPAGGNVTVNGNGYSDGAIITLPRAATNDVSAFASRTIGGVLYDFDHWEKQNLNLNLGATANPNTISIGAASATLTAIYVVHVDTATVTLQSQNANGTAKLVYGPNTYTAGASQTITIPKSSIIQLSATANAGFGFTGWDDGTAGGWVTTIAGFDYLKSAQQSLAGSVIDGRTFRATFKAGYMVTIYCGANGTVDYGVGIVGAGSNVTVFVASGDTLSLLAIPNVDFNFANWIRVNASGTTTLISPSLNEVITSTSIYRASFVKPNDRLDWYQNFGLNPNVAGDPGPNGDPDNDGLSNESEYRIYAALLSNDFVRAQTVSPLNADSDGDGMDDNYEYFHIVDTNAPGPVGNQKNGLAMTTPDGIYGPAGNPDGDFHWNTNNGYLTTQPLSNMEEYTGPDAASPYNFESVPAGGTGALDGWVNTIVGKTVKRRVANPADTQDTSFSDTSFTGGDNMDDGFKWTWDFWQSNNVGREIANTNIWPQITNKVPSWAVSRLFKPSATFVEPAEGFPSYDVWYNPVLNGLVPAGARRSVWVTVIDKYHASALISSNSVAFPFPLVRQNPPPGNPAWCVNPFLWDTDGDGLPDGWELTFGYDPWATKSLGIKGTDDGHDNPSGKWYAQQGAWSAINSNRHNQVYINIGYDPRTGYGYSVPLRTVAGAPNTAQFINLEAIRGAGAGPFFPGVYTDDRPVSPYAYDSDGDDMWDGWEFYVGLDPQDPTDGVPNPDADGLPNLDEFQSYTTSTNLEATRTFVAGWRNKLWPTDPNDSDTDWDQILDGPEKVNFNYTTNGLAQVTIDTNTMYAATLFFEGGGLNPTSADTDGDHLPDAWESKYPGQYGVTTNQIVTTNVITTIDTNGVTTIVTNITVTGVTTNNTWSGGMNGTMADDKADYDGDGLVNYQEYLCGAVYNWQFTVWAGGKGLYGYDPYDFFDPSLSGGGQWYMGPGGRGPHVWDPHYIIGPIYHPVNWRFMTAYEHLSGLWFSSTDPGSVDTDRDSMDDYYEVYHGLDPLFGGYDVVMSKIRGVPIYVPTLPIHRDWLGSGDFLNYPWIAGCQTVDPDQDGLKNEEESLQKNAAGVPYYHTDPSPLWMTDFSSPDSWAILYYWTGNVFANPMSPDWYWNNSVLALTEPPPSYLFSFEANEGYDTDNDNISDKAELAGDTQVTTGLTDPLNGQSPIKRRALYLNGDAAARTRDPHVVTRDEFRQFTVEAWVRPENPVAGKNQVVVERCLYITPGSYFNISGLRHNFRIGINAQGLPYAAYDNAEGSPVTACPVATAAQVLRANEWVHLACTYGGSYDSQGNAVWALQLYRDGNLIATTPSALIPANGWLDGYNGNPAIFFWTPAAYVVGAADSNPDGWVDGAPILIPPFIRGPLSQPALSDFFQGWVDHIAIWDGVRSPGQIRTDKTTRMTRGQVYQAATSAGAPSVLKAYFTFDNRPDPDHSPVSPAGFQVLNEYPASYTVVPWWATAADRSKVYDDYRYVPWLENMVSHLPLNPPRDGNGAITNGLFRNTANPYGLWYMHNSSGLYESNPQTGLPLTASADSITALLTLATVPDLLPLRWAVTDEDVPMWDGGGKGSDPYDSDGDGLPDAWEELYGLDPLNPNGLNGTYGDPDSDGLNNWAEFMAGTNPQNYDSFGSGAPDFYNWVATNKVIFGERFTDHDFMEDSWELAHFVAEKLDPRRYDAQLDADGDGWSNYAEFMAGTAPDNNGSFPTPVLSGTIRFDANTLPTNGTVLPTPVLLLFTTPDMDEVPVFCAVQPSAVTNSTGPSNMVTIVDSWQFRAVAPKEGDVWLLAFMDYNNNGRLDAGEPAGLADGQPVRASWSALGGIEIPLTDNAAGFGRFSWPNTGSTLPTRVQISSTSLGSASPLTRFIRPARSYFDEQDFMQLGYLNGLPSGTYTWSVSRQSQTGQFTAITNGTFAFTYGAMTAPTLVSPIGGEIRRYTRNTFKFAADGSSTVRVYLRVYRGVTVVTPLVYEEIARLPYQHEDGYRYLMPTNLYFGGPGFENGIYTWVLESLNGDGAAAFSVGGSFTVDTTTVKNPLGPFALGGTLSYYGKVTGSGNLVVEASLRPSFAGLPEGRWLAPNSSTASAWPTNRFTFMIPGLPGGSYYVRGYLDQNNSRRLDTTDTRGYLTSVTSFYSLATVLAQDINTNLELRMSAADTDNDGIADDWEIATTGGLGSMGLGTFSVTKSMGVSAFMTDLEWYLYGTMNLNASDPNATGLDGIPLRIKSAFGMNLVKDYDFMISGVTTDAQGMPVVIWARDKWAGNLQPTSSGYQVQSTSDSSVVVNFKVQYSQDLKTWNDVSGAMPDGPVKYDANAGLFRYVGAPTSCPYFYRVQIAW